MICMEWWAYEVGNSATSQGLCQGGTAASPGCIKRLAQHAPRQARPTSRTHTAQVVILWAGLLPDAQLTLSTMGICLSLNAYMYMLPLGLASSVNTNIANALGGGDGARAGRVFAGGLAAAVALQAAIVGGVTLG